MWRRKHGPRVSRAWTGCHPAVGVSEENVAAAGSNHLNTDSSKSAHRFLASEPRETSHTEICWMPASSSGVEFWGSSSRAQLNHFVYALHEPVEILGLGTSPQGGYCCYVVALLVRFDKHCELAYGSRKGILA